jgi:hypothetical protein
VRGPFGLLRQLSDASLDRPLDALTFPACISALGAKQPFMRKQRLAAARARVQSELIGLGSDSERALNQIPDIRFCSLIPCSWFLSSLFSKIFSLLSFVGNWPRNRCSTAVSCSEIRFSGPEVAKFPVKFPDSREFLWRRVRSALRRQPGVFGEFSSRGRRAVGHHGGRVVWSR